ncbi:hypothetical protein [Bradyrhizobium sp. UFLA05-112]
MPLKLSLQQNPHDIGHPGIVDRTLDLDPPMQRRRNFDSKSLHFLHVNTQPSQNTAGTIEMLKRVSVKTHHKVITALSL